MVHESGVSTRYDIAKQVLASHQHMAAPAPAFEGVLLDATSAGVIVAVCEALSPANLARVDKLPLSRFMAFCWSRVSAAY